MSQGCAKYCRIRRISNAICRNSKSGGDKHQNLQLCRQISDPARLSANLESATDPSKGIQRYYAVNINAFEFLYCRHRSTLSVQVETNSQSNQHMVH